MHMNTKQRLKELMDERHWTEYRLAVASGLSQSTISNIFHRDSSPSIATLEAICNGLGISLSQFFANGNLVELTEEQTELFQRWVNLTKEQKNVLSQLITIMNKSESQ